MQLTASNNIELLSELVYMEKHQGYIGYHFRLKFDDENINKYYTNSWEGLSPTQWEEIINVGKKTSSVVAHILDAFGFDISYCKNYNDENSYGAFFHAIKEKKDKCDKCGKANHITAYIHKFFPCTLSIHSNYELCQCHKKERTTNGQKLKNKKQQKQYQKGKWYSFDLKYGLKNFPCDFKHPGLYAFFNNGNCLYVGQGKQVGSRARCHVKMGKDKIKTDWGNFKELQLRVKGERCTGERLMLEERLIQRIKPAFNTMFK